LSSIIKPLPPEWFIDHGTNAEMRWEAMGGQGFCTPNERFFVRNHTRTPMIDVGGWRLRLFGDGLRFGPVEYGYRDLLRMPATTMYSAIECTGNGRSFFGSQQGRSAAGTPWRLGGIGVARWRGVRLAHVLEHAGLADGAVEVMPIGLDPPFVEDGVDHGRVRRPLPIGKAMDDVLIAYEMNGERLPPDHGFPARLVVPGWVGIASVKWLGAIEVSGRRLTSPWNTLFYRMDGEPLSRIDGAKSAFELAWNAVLEAGCTHLLRGRSWSALRDIARVCVSTDGGTSWRPARLEDGGGAWVCWSIDWRPARHGRYRLMARAGDRQGVCQPQHQPYNENGYLFGAIVAHPVTVAEPSTRG
jgi:DMSO/TMAO reductase YedYZ molybdopterin-dependent catalytic subunit